MRGLLTSLFVCAALLLPSAAPAGDSKTDEWQPMYDRNGVRSFRRTPEESRIQEFRGEGEIAANAYKILAVIRRTDRGTEWIPDLVEIVSMGFRDNGNELVYAHFNVPWPAKNRDFLYEEGLKFDKAAKTWTVTLKSTTDGNMPEKDGVVRANLLVSEYTVTWLDEHRSWVTVRIHTDPKGGLPISIVNLVTRKWPWETITHLREQSLKADGYEEAIERLRGDFPL